LPFEIGQLIRHVVQINPANNTAASKLIEPFAKRTDHRLTGIWSNVKRVVVRRWRSIDTATRLSTGVGPPTYHSAVRLRLYLGAGVVSGIAAYLLGTSPFWSVAIGAVAPAVFAAVPHFLRGALIGVSTRDDVTAEMSGTEFEDFVAQVVRSCGVPVIMTSITGDWGVDIIVGRRPNRLAIQCKRQSRPVGTRAIQEVVAGAPMQDCTRTMVVTNHEFTPAARKLAELHGCELVGRSELPRLRSAIRRLTASA
jgi:restriction system protein